MPAEASPRETSSSAARTFSACAILLETRAHAPSFLRSNPTVPTADARLETQAEAAAGLHERGLPQAWAWERAVSPFLGRADVSWTPPPTPYTVSYAGGDRTITQEVWAPEEDPTAVRINLGAFVVPQTKGNWQPRYDAVRTIEAFTTRLREEIDLDALGAEFTSVVVRTMQPSRVSIWMLPRRGRSG